MAHLRSQRRRLPCWAAGVAAVLAVALVWAWRLHVDPRVVVLRPSPTGARWVRIDRPFDVGSRQNVATTVSFAAVVDGPVGPVEAVCTGRTTVSLDGQPIPNRLTPGRHLLRVDVSNDNGPSLARVSGAGVATGVADWRASDDGGRTWARAVPADEPWEPSTPPQFGPTGRDLLRWSPLWAVLGAVGTIAMLRRPTGADWGRRVRWAVLVGWTVLAANDIGKVPLASGYDVDSHYQYIQYVADHLRLPPADGGWQFFQAPLYYIVSAVLQRLGAGPHGLRVLPLACGAAVAELSYRAARATFPGRGDLQAVATAVGGLLPVNLYMAQTVSNEPMAAAAAGLVVWATLSLIAHPDGVRSTRRLAWLGAALGTAWLAKVSGLLWTVPVAGVLVTLLNQQRTVDKQRAENDPGQAGSTSGDWSRLLVVPAVALLVSGWYFAKNLVQVGRPFFRESSVAQLQWWQDPGYRTPGNLVEFGHVFARPVYNGLGSVWDSLYGTLWGNGIPSGRPPWNYGLMGAGLWLAWVPMALVVTGAVVAVVGRRPDRVALRFAAVAVALFVAAIVNVYLTLPIYSCAKASYMLGTAPCLAVLAAAGFDQLRRHRRGRAVVGGLVFCWAAVAWMTYFIV